MAIPSSPSGGAHRARRRCRARRADRQVRGGRHRPPDADRGDDARRRELIAPRTAPRTASTWIDRTDRRAGRTRYGATVSSTVVAAASQTSGPRRERGGDQRGERTGDDDRERQPQVAGERQRADHDDHGTDRAEDIDPGARCVEPAGEVGEPVVETLGTGVEPIGDHGADDDHQHGRDKADEVARAPPDAAGGHHPEERTAANDLA